MEDSQRQRENSGEAAASPVVIRAALDEEFEQLIATRLEAYAQLGRTLQQYLNRTVPEGTIDIRCTLMDRPVASTSIFDADRLHGALEFHLADALRELANALDSGKITGKLALPSGHGAWVAAACLAALCGVGGTLWALHNPEPRCPVCRTRLLNMEDGTHWCTECCVGYRSGGVR